MECFTPAVSFVSFTSFTSFTSFISFVSIVLFVSFVSFVGLYVGDGGLYSIGDLLLLLRRVLAQEKNVGLTDELSGAPEKQLSKFKVVA